VTPDLTDLLGPALTAAVEALVDARVAAVVADLPTAEQWPEFMDVPTAAAYCTVPEGRIRKLLDHRTLPRIQEARGCRVLIARADLDALLASWRTGEVTPRR
jgi:hypothetical protein